MHAFFRVIEENRYMQEVIAETMGYSAAHFSRIKTGRIAPTRRFRRDAARAISDLGIRKGDGSEYTVEELFFASVEEPALAVV